MPSPSRRPAFTLVEAIIAAFLLLTSMLVVAALVDTSLQTQAQSEQYLMASMIASNELDKMRGHATRYGMAELDPFDGQAYTSESDSAFRVRLQVTPHRLHLPNSSLESQLPEEDRKVFENSARLVRIQVGWSDSARDSVEVFSLISDWRAADFEVEVTADGGTTVPPDGTLELTASTGAVKDLVFTWYVEPLTGLGSIQEVSRDGQTALYVNRFKSSASRFEYYPGTCRVTVRAQFRNVVKTGSIELENVE
ncbi:MAG: hypothetical protein WC314_03365 [Vulcanimicrobiota bacterium]